MCTILVPSQRPQEFFDLRVYQACITSKKLPVFDLKWVSTNHTSDEAEVDAHVLLILFCEVPRIVCCFTELNKDNQKKIIRENWNSTSKI